MVKLDKSTLSFVNGVFSDVGVTQDQIDNASRLSVKLGRLEDRVREVLTGRGNV